jgi:hypothetical protein
VDVKEGVGVEERQDMGNANTSSIIAKKKKKPGVKHCLRDFKKEKWKLKGAQRKGGNKVWGYGRMSIRFGKCNLSVGYMTTA